MAKNVVELDVLDEEALVTRHDAPGLFTDLRISLSKLPREDLPEFLGGIALLEAEARLRLNDREPARLLAEDRLLDVKEAAIRLCMSVSELYKTADDFPFTIKRGRTVRFSSLGIDRWIFRRAR